MTQFHGATGYHLKVLRASLVSFDQHREQLSLMGSDKVTFVRRARSRTLAAFLS